MYLKVMIVEAEELIHKRLPYVDISESDRRIVIHLRYLLGSVYVTTCQYRRALDSFETCFGLDGRIPQLFMV